MDELWTNLLNLLFLTFNFQKSVDCGNFENVESANLLREVVPVLRQYMERFL